MPPLIGITVNRLEPQGKAPCYESAAAYSQAVAAAGGLPVLMPCLPETVESWLERLDGLILTGGYDPDTTCFDQPLHPEARVIDPQRQAFEVALLRGIQARNTSGEPALPTLGICLGMQLMALVAGGRLDQYMPESHRELGMDHNAHGETVVSSHRQCVSDAGTLSVLGLGPGQVIEAIGDLHAPFYLGVQWHPERGGAGPLSQGLFAKLLAAARQNSTQE